MAVRHEISSLLEKMENAGTRLREAGLGYGNDGEVETGLDDPPDRNER